MVLEIEVAATTSVPKREREGSPEEKGRGPLL